MSLPGMDKWDYLLRDDVDWYRDESPYTRGKKKDPVQDKKDYELALRILEKKRKHDENLIKNSPGRDIWF